ncbi:MAG: acyl transferase [Bacteroidetes bacterium]|nr:acyl transferase [Bacteroidota bacterium]
MFTNVQEAENSSAYRHIKETLLEGKKLEWDELALSLFELQYFHNPIYKDWCDHLNKNPQKVNALSEIPFLPIDFFKSQKLSIFQSKPQTYFQSSGTGGYGSSKHAAYDLDFYDELCQQAFEAEYGALEDFCVFALLPAYLEREGSSLVRMADRFIARTKDSDSGFFLNDLDRLKQLLAQKQKDKKPTLLLGVSFALWDLAEKFPQDLSNIIIMETGGMKGRRKELIRGELHQIFKEAFKVESIHSEYGMTELFSQAYSQGNGIFKASRTMQVFARELEDPFSPARNGKSGGLNIIDLANLNSCAFIETQDLGRVHENGTFEVLGRFDRAEVRGCNLMLA